MECNLGPIKKLGFLDTEPVNGLPCAVTPYQFLDKFLGPRLQYKDNEKDLVAMINVFEGISEGKQVRLTSTMLIERSLDTGLMAMSKGVGYPASIVAQMINNREITAKGILTPALHVPWKPFMEKLSERGIVIHEKRNFKLIKVCFIYSFQNCLNTKEDAMKIKHVIVLIMALLLTAMLVSTAIGGALTEIVKRGELRVAVQSGAAPYAFVDKMENIPAPWLNSQGRWLKEWVWN